MAPRSRRKCGAFYFFSPLDLASIALLSPSVLHFAFDPLFPPRRDTAGQERYSTITNVYYRGSIGALIVYDVTSQASLAAIPHWLRELRDHARRDIVLMLVGNKIDCDDDAAAAAAEGPEAVAAAAAAAAQGLAVGTRQVPRAEAEALAAEYGLMFAEVSAKTGEGVEDAVTRLLARAYEVTVAGEAAAAAAGGQNEDQASAAQIDVTKPAGGEGDSGKCCK